MRYNEFKKKIDEIIPAVGPDMASVGGPAVAATKMINQQISKTMPKSAANTVPAIGKQVILPDRDTKRPAPYTIKKITGGEAELTPAGMATSPTKPSLVVKVRLPDLQNSMNALGAGKKTS